MRIGDVGGTVIHLGVLSTKIKTLRNEEVTIPERGGRLPDNDRLLASWRHGRCVHADVGDDRLRRAVAPGARVVTAGRRARTSGLRQEPKPVVLQASLEDFYVKYTLLVVPRTADGAAASRSARCTRTSRICSTSTACRSCRRTTCVLIPPRRRSCRRRTGLAARAPPLGDSPRLAIVNEHWVPAASEFTRRRHVSEQRVTRLTNILRPMRATG